MQCSNRMTWATVLLLLTVAMEFDAFSAHAVANSRGNAGQRPLDAIADPNGFRPDLAEKLEMTVNSVGLSATLLPPFDGDPALSERILTVSVSFPFKRRDGILGVDLTHPVILDATDAWGGRIALLPTEWDWHRYEKLSYAVDYSTPSPTSTPPGTLVHLRFDPHQNVPSSLSSLKWYVHALHTENFVEVDVPFEISDEWIEAETIPELEVRIDKAESISLVDSAGVQRYLHQYSTVVRSRDGTAVRGRNEELQFGDAPPKYIVLETRFLTQWGTFFPSDQSVRGDPRGSGAYCSGESEYFHAIHGIRHIIAVDPVAVKLPFDLTDIPVPSLQTVSGSIE